MTKPKRQTRSIQAEQIVLESIRERVTRKGSSRFELAMQLAQYEAIQAKIEAYKSKIAKLQEQLAETKREAARLENPKRRLARRNVRRHQHASNR